MKKFTMFLTALLFLTFGKNAISQETDCKVLLEPISGTYIGDCKKGLAHGEGVAKGTDIYSGKFKKGLPDGEGVYTFADGGVYIGSFNEGKKSGLGKFKLPDGTIAKEGIWENDEFVKEQDVPDYRIIVRRNVLNVSIRELGGDENRVEIVMVRDGRESTSNIHDLMIVTNSGVQFKDDHSVVYKDMVYPFTANVKFKAVGKFTSSTLSDKKGASYQSENVQMPESVVEFEIKEQGNWEVRIKY